MTKKNIFNTSAFEEFSDVDNGYFLDIKTSFKKYEAVRLLAIYPDFILISLDQDENDILFINRNEILYFKENTWRGFNPLFFLYMPCVHKILLMSPLFP